MIFAFAVQISDSYQVSVEPYPFPVSVEHKLFSFGGKPHPLFAVAKVVHIIFAANPKFILNIVPAFLIALSPSIPPIGGKGIRYKKYR